MPFEIHDEGFGFPAQHSISCFAGDGIELLRQQADRFERPGLPHLQHRWINERIVVLAEDRNRDVRLDDQTINA